MNPPHLVRSAGLQPVRSRFAPPTQRPSSSCSACSSNSRLGSRNCDYRLGSSRRPTAAPLARLPARVTFPIEWHIMLPEVPSPVRFHLGDVPVVVEPAADELLSRLPGAALSKILSALTAWSATAPVKKLHVYTLREPEDDKWDEAVLDFTVNADDDTAFAIWDSLAAAVDGAKAALPEQQRLMLSRKLGIHLSW